MEEAVQRTQEAYAAPIEFYGKVIDQKGGSVPFAEITWTAADHFGGRGSSNKTRSNESGLFEIRGIRGAILAVMAEKEGYERIHNKSNAAFAYGIAPDSITLPPPSEERPALLLLRKMGPTEALESCNTGQVILPQNGSIVKVDITSGKAGTNPHHISVTSWVSFGTGRRFDWKYRLAVPGGGIVERSDLSIFIAPVSGYEGALEIGLSAEAPDWAARAERDYFVKFFDGTFCRLTARFYPGRRNFIVIDALYNPKLGSRNLEFNPKVRAN